MVIVCGQFETRATMTILSGVGGTLAQVKRMARGVGPTTPSYITISAVLLDDVSLGSFGRHDSLRACMFFHPCPYSCTHLCILSVFNEH